ncbi:MAG TPA: hypothetical protein VNF27_02225 [Candidatus Binataceae bacterium]|nr:hypothetical protein [Candidatus Binataceae bacterium]
MIWRAMTRLIVAVVAIALFSGCALTDEPQSGQFSLIKPGMDRTTVVQNLGTPPQSQMANGQPVSDSWACEPDGQIVEVKMSAGWLVAEYLLTLGIAGLVDAARLYKVQQRVNKCDVQYGADGKVERTSSMHGPLVQSP